MCGSQGKIENIRESWEHQGNLRKLGTFGENEEHQRTWGTLGNLIRKLLEIREIWGRLGEIQEIRGNLGNWTTFGDIGKNWGSQGNWRNQGLPIFPNVP